MNKNKNLIKSIKLLMLSALLVALVIVVYIGSSPQRFDLNIGQVSDIDISAPRTIVDSYETNKAALESKISVKPIFVRSNELSDTSKNRVNSFFDLCQNIRDENITSDGQYLDSHRSLATQLQEQTLSTYAIELTDDEAFQLVTADASLLRYIRSQSISVANLVIMESLTSQNLKEEINNYMSSVEDSELSFYVSNQELILSLLTDLILPNVVVDTDATTFAEDQAYDHAIRNPILIEKGTRIISLGDVINEHQFQMLEDLDLLENNTFDLPMFAGIFFYMLTIFVAISLYFVRFESEALSHPRDMVAIIIAFIIPIIATLYLSDISPLINTVFFTTVIIATYLGIQSGIVISLIQVLIVLPIQNFSVESIFVSVIGIFVCAVIAGQKRRKFNSSSLILFTAMSCFMASFAYSLVTKATRFDMFSAVLWAIISASVSVVAAVGSMPMFELISNTVSPVRLIDLSQPGNPLLKRLFLEAPGTSQHSMMVANLADSAAEAIGADALLAKVGAYYHDIGKLDNPTFFTENQQVGQNPHDTIPPEDSVAIITAHPDYGVRLARKSRLPNSIIRIINEHHGSTVQTYFYHKAKTNAAQAGQLEPSIRDYQYKGEIPSSKESAVVMLADTCEAALRSNGINNIQDAEVLFRKLIKNKIDQDQLIHSGLSFNDIETIIRAFLQVYAGYFHERIKYPDDSNVR